MCHASLAIHTKLCTAYKLLLPSRVGIYNIFDILFVGSRRFLLGLRSRTASVVVAFEVVFADRNLKLLAGLEHSRHFFRVGESSHANRLDVRSAPLLRQRTHDLQLDRLDRRVLLSHCLQKRVN